MGNKANRAKKQGRKGKGKKKELTVYQIMLEMRKGAQKFRTKNTSEQGHVNGKKKRTN
jgi:hypothetical protein